MRRGTWSDELRASNGELRIPVSQLALRAPSLDAYRDDSFEPARSRIRALVAEENIKNETLLPMATMVRAEDGGPLRTMAGNLAHENGWLSIFKAKRLLHWQGIAQRSLLIRTASDHRWVTCETENVRIEVSDGIQNYKHTIDVWLTREDGFQLGVEMKRDERDLEDPHTRRRIALAAECYRRCGIGFALMFRDEVYKSRHHRRNAELFASRSFVRVTSKHLERLEKHALLEGCMSTYGALAEALEPTSLLHGRALVQALTCRRRVEIDISEPLHAGSPLIIH